MEKEKYELTRLHVSWFVVLGKDGGGGREEKQRGEKGEMPLLNILEKHVKKKINGGGRGMEWGEMRK